jgi:hypothetical protein
MLSSHLKIFHQLFTQLLVCLDQAICGCNLAASDAKLMPGENNFDGGFSSSLRSLICCNVLVNFVRLYKVGNSMGNEVFYGQTSANIPANCC